MRILLDHNLDWRLWELLQPHEVITTKRMRWDRYENGELLEVAQTEFDVLLTTDTNLYHQQKVADYDLAVVVLRSYQNSLEALSPLMEPVMDLRLRSPLTLTMPRPHIPAKLRRLVINRAGGQCELGAGPYSSLTLS
jgi:predicted nuclease of predicted toxin-antitoxin system